MIFLSHQISQACRLPSRLEAAEIVASRLVDVCVLEGVEGAAEKWQASVVTGYKGVPATHFYAAGCTCPKHLRNCTWQAKKYLPHVYE